MRLAISTSCFVLAASAMCLAAPASAQSYEPGRILKGIGIGDLRAIVASYQDEVIEEGITENPSLAARSTDGTVYLLLGTACADQAIGCQGVNMQVRFDMDDADYALVNEINMSEQACNTWFDAETKTLGVSRYVVLDYGITMENLRENVNVLLAVSGNVAEYFE